MPLRPPAGFISTFYDPLKTPNAPTGVTGTGGDASASVAFTAPANTGGSAITAYYAVSNPSNITVTGASSPISVTGLTNGTSYTFQVWALNSYGPGVWSAASGSVTPVATYGVFAGGDTTNGNVYSSVMDYVSIATTGNATSFGSLSTALQYAAGCGSTTRGLIGGGYSGSNVVAINYITFATPSNTTSFGSLTAARYSLGSCASATRGVFIGGAPSTNVMDYVTIASTGNATLFGTLSTARSSLNGGCNSPTRGVVGGGDSNSTEISYITIASTGNSTSFGSLQQGTFAPAACSSSTIGIFAGGTSFGSKITGISQITIATTGNATSFGTLSTATSDASACSSNTRGLIGGGVTGPSATTNVIGYVTFASAGNPTSFGSLTVSRGKAAACSNGSGGVQ